MMSVSFVFKIRLPRSREPGTQDVFRVLSTSAIIVLSAGKLIGIVSKDGVNA